MVENLKDYDNMPIPEGNMTLISNNILIFYQLSSDRVALAKEWKKLLSTMPSTKRCSFDKL